MAAIFRHDLHNLAGVRATEARYLLDGGLWDGAYYLAGYAVECGLKACIAAQRQRYEFPDRQLALDSFTHNLEQLVQVAGLRADLDVVRSASATFDDNWLTVRAWKESSRYERHSEGAARGMVEAVVNPRNGVMAWIRRHW